MWAAQRPSDKFRCGAQEPKVDPICLKGIPMLSTKTILQVAAVAAFITTVAIPNGPADASKSWSPSCKQIPTQDKCKK
jgi:hypothetical protein